jgi:hypothetical protein
MELNRFCEQCGVALSEGANFCAACGTKVPFSAKPDESLAADSPDVRASAEPSKSEQATPQRPRPWPPSREPAEGSEPSLLPTGDESKAKSRKRWLYVIAAVFGIAIVIGIIAAVATGSKNASAPTASVTHKCSFYPTSQPKPQTCMSHTDALCSSYSFVTKPADCLSVAQLVVQNKVRKRVAARERVRAKKRAAAAKRAAARAKVAARRAAARAAAQAKARAAAVAAANAWHAGYNEQSGSVFWKWQNGGSCADYAQYGCWHVVVITKYGCPSYVAVNANEYQHGAIINQLLDNQGYGIPAKTPRVFELDADAGNVTANDVSIDCE